MRDDEIEAAREGDVFRHRTDGDLCRVTGPAASGSGWLTDLHDGTFGLPTERELAECWERIARGVSDAAFRAMRCTCNGCRKAPDAG